MGNILKYVINLIVFVPFTIALIIITIRISKASFNGLWMNKYVKILEKTNLNKDTEVYVLKVGDEGFVIVSSATKTDTIKELTKKEVEEIEKKQIEIKNNKVNMRLKIEDLKKFRLKGNKNGRISTNSFK